ncbi:hypothetical protein [Stecheria intestinalis]|uniref:hypothetical protein n=1 Tax=Stecheria intestinalis TaxID=2606630 RepID=UPI0012B1F42A|nr:hypothetical protein [Stecheria intestinalis]MDY4682197.1 hypothetical protein [Lachnospiraceae bacterium]
MSAEGKISERRWASSSTTWRLAMAKQIFLPVRSDSEIVSTIISVLPGSAACLHENVGMQDVLGACMADLLLGFGQRIAQGIFRSFFRYV